MIALLHPLSCVTVFLALALLARSPVFAADGKVEGRVTLKGQPVAAGKIMFHLDKGQFVGSNIKGGDYQIDRVPIGIRRITIEGKGVPAKYAEGGIPDFEVQKGRNVFDIALE